MKFDEIRLPVEFGAEVWVLDEYKPCDEIYLIPYPYYFNAIIMRKDNLLFEVMDDNKNIKIVGKIYLTEEEAEKESGFSK